MASVVEQTLGAMPAVQAFTREPVQELRFRHHAEQTIRAYTRSALTGMGFQLVTGLVLTLGTAAVIYVGGTLALEGALTAGTIVVFVAYVASLYEPIESLSHTTQTIQTAAAETDRVMEIMEIEPAVADLPRASDRPVAGAVSYENVVFGYEPGRPVLHDISFTAEPGEVLAIVGPTCATSSCDRCAARSRWCCRTPSSSPRRSQRTSPSDGPTPHPSRSAPPPKPPTRTPSSSACRTATTRS
jgi:ABC-type multidrug transport system fused ATPase/permease subunit